MTRTVTVRIPASTSNLGAGFDCVGIALDRRLELRASIAPNGTAVTLERRGTLTALTGPPARDFIYKGFAAACRAAGRRLPRGLRLKATSDIPVARGLGSSAAAFVAGAAAARALLRLDLSVDDVFRLAAAEEGHPDNAAPAVYGGARLVVRSNNGTSSIVPLQIHRSLSLVFAIPDFTVATERARAVLPERVPFRTAVTAAARAAALVRGLAAADAGLLATALDDVLHVPHRRRLVKGYVRVVNAAKRAGAFGATLSGSGSSIVAIAPAGTRASAVGRAMVREWARHGVQATTFAGRPNHRRLGG